ncbi:MAG: HTH-type transcriptional activator IlvY [Desulfobacter sp.]|nr:HTH-type transcriptional activator IlvY [Desulfobacter sp.]WDP84814.1 MAG: HTH-type transcriptional activator IlvY [Desulfobacter sp.]
MDIRTLELFRHLSGSLHFARTSQACHITPSALTRVIQRLEGDVGETLFFRNNRSVELTHAGMAFRAYAEDVLRRWDLLQGQLSEDEILHGELSLYCSVTAAYSILPRIITLYRTLHPKVQIRLETGDPAQSLSRLMNREADAVIAALPGKLAPQVSFLSMATSPLVFIAAKQYPDVIVKTHGRIDWEKTPMILADTGLSRERMDVWFARKRVVPNVYSRVAGHEAILALVNLGCGMGLVPRIVLEKSPFAREMTILEHMPDLPPYEIGLCTRKNSLASPRIQALWEIGGQSAAKY